MKLQFQIPKSEPRDIDQITEHYVLEKHLAWTLRHSRKEERLGLYTLLYDELFRNIPHHPQSTRKDDKAASWQEVSRKMNLVKPYLKPDTIFVEIGPGDCQFAFEISKTVEQIFAVDVSEEITQNGSTPSNFNLIISNGCSIPLADGTASVVYSNQLMEHLHPEDSQEQLKEIYRVLQPGGHYICITPNRLAGPHDISKYFDRVATGFHLQEYTHRELYDLFKSAGFSKILTYMGGKGIYYRFSHILTLAVEALLNPLPFKIKYRAANFLPIRAILGVILVAQK